MTKYTIAEIKVVSDDMSACDYTCNRNDLCPGCKFTIDKASTIIDQLLNERESIREKIEELMRPLESDFDEKLRNSAIKEVLSLFES